MQGVKHTHVGGFLAAPVVIGKELFTYFIRVDGAPTYSFITALSGGILNIVLDYILVGQMQMGIYGAALATILGLVLSFSMGIYYFIHKQKYLSFTLHNLSLREAMHCMLNGASEFVNQLAIAVTTIVFNRTALSFAGEDGVAAVFHHHVSAAFCLSVSTLAFLWAWHHL